MVQSKTPQKYAFIYVCHCTSTCNDCLLKSTSMRFILYFFMLPPSLQFSVYFFRFLSHSLCLFMLMSKCDMCFHYS